MVLQIIQLYREVKNIENHLNLQITQNSTCTNEVEFQVRIYLFYKIYIIVIFQKIFYYHYLTIT